MKRWMTIVPAVGLFAIAYLELDRTEETPTRREPSAAAAKLERRGSSPSPLRARPPQLPETVVDDERSSPPAAAALETRASKPELTSQDIRDGFDGLFHREAMDSAWSAREADSLTAGVRAVLPAGSQLSRLECRATLCRIETTHADLEEFHSFTRAAFFARETRVNRAGLYSTLLSDPSVPGPVIGVAFLAREGTELPSPDILFANR